MTLDFPYKTEPRDHQRDELDISRNLEPRGLWWEMGVGKTKPVIDTVAHLAAAREITGLAVLAPAGVHENWVYNELPKHLHDGVAEVTRSKIWHTKKAKAQYFRKDFEKLLAHEGFAILTMTYDSLMTDAGAVAMKAFLKSRPCMYVADEATVFSRPGAKTTKRVLASAEYARWKRVLNGTPVADSPFQAYSQVRFAKRHAWRDAYEIANYEDFKHFFGRWIVQQSKDGKRMWPQLVNFKRLQMMHEVMDSIGSRLLKVDVLDLPPKSYQKIYYELTSSQQRMYDQLKKSMYATFPDGAEVTAALAIVQLTRFQQICSGYLPADDESELRRIDERAHPRLDVLRELLLTVPRKAIVWAKYDIDVDEISQLCRKLKMPSVVYDGRTSAEDRQLAIERFQNGDAQFFIAKPSAAGMGLTLTAADVVIYYNNAYSLSKRLQSEDRAHRIGQERPVLYYDIIARDTVDEKILDSLRQKRVLAAMVTGDELQDWI